MWVKTFSVIFSVETIKVFFLMAVVDVYKFFWLTPWT